MHKKKTKSTESWNNVIPTDRPTNHHHHHMAKQSKAKKKHATKTDKKQRGKNRVNWIVSAYCSTFIPILSSQFCFTILILLHNIMYFVYLCVRMQPAATADARRSCRPYTNNMYNDDNNFSDSRHTWESVLKMHVTDNTENWNKFKILRTTNAVWLD